MKISRRRRGGILIAIAGDELVQLLAQGALLTKCDSVGVIQEITDRIHFELTQFLYPPARTESDPAFTPSPFTGRSQKS